MAQCMIKAVRTAFLMLLLFSALTGLVYPLIVMAVAQVLFPWQANGSIVKKNEKELGSMLIGQFFTDPKYFWGRPSATTPFPYNAEYSSGSNLGPFNPDLLKAIKGRKQDLQKVDPGNHLSIPVDLITASGSGLDPEISPLAAFYQVHRVARARNIPAQKVSALVKRLSKERQMGVLGEPRVNVLMLNLELDYLSSKQK